MPTNNGIISTPISVDDVAKTLGVSSYDVGYLCYNGHGKTNKWSAKKPIKSNTPAVLSDDAFKNTNFGLTIDDSTMSSVNLNDLFKQKDWEYDCPTEASGSYARLTDFNGYNHKALCPIVAEISAVNLAAPNNPLISVILSGNIPGADMKLSDFRLFSGANSVWGFAYRKQGTTNAIYVGWSQNHGGTPTNPVTALAELSAAVAPGTYEVIGLIFRTNDMYYLVPNSYKIVTVRQLTTEEHLELTITPNLSVTIAGKNRIYCSMNIVNRKNSSRSIRYSYTINRYKTNGMLSATLSSESNKTATIASLATATINMGQSGNETVDETGDYGGYYLLQLTVYVDSSSSSITKSERYDL